MQLLLRLGSLTLEEASWHAWGHSSGLLNHPGVEGWWINPPAKAEADLPYWKCPMSPRQNLRWLQPQQTYTKDPKLEPPSQNIPDTQKLWGLFIYASVNLLVYIWDAGAQIYCLEYARHIFYTELQSICYYTFIIVFSCWGLLHSNSLLAQRASNRRRDGIRELH